jgi:hypothetical protein
MNRRRFIGTVAGGLVVAPLDVVAQQMAKMFRIGVMDPFPASDPVNTILHDHLRAWGHPAPNR